MAPLVPFSQLQQLLIDGSQAIWLPEANSEDDMMEGYNHDVKFYERGKTTRIASL